MAADLTQKQVEAMLLQLREHYHQPVMPVGAYCDAFRSWLTAIEDAVKREPGSLELSGMLERLRDVQTDVFKSNMLYRLLYLGEPVRTEMCPIHKGHWSGCASPERECPHCMSGSDVTGWVGPTQADRTNAMKEAFGKIYGPPSKPVFVYLGSTLLDAPGMAASDKRPFIFTVTSLDCQEEGRHPKSRCWGWFETWEQAEEYLYKDYGDIHEGGTNKFAVIEKSESGICPSTYDTERRWYRFIRLEDQDFKWTVERIEPPEEYLGVCGWGLG
jgi:hypothetical protein